MKNPISKKKRCNIFNTQEKTEKTQKAGKKIEKESKTELLSEKVNIELKNKIDNYLKENVDNSKKSNKTKKSANIKNESALELSAKEKQKRDEEAALEKYELEKAIKESNLEADRKKQELAKEQQIKMFQMVQERKHFDDEKAKFMKEKEDFEAALKRSEIENAKKRAIFELKNLEELRQKNDRSIYELLNENRIDRLLQQHYKQLYDGYELKDKNFTKDQLKQELFYLRIVHVAAEKVGDDKFIKSNADKNFEIDSNTAIMRNLGYFDIGIVN